MKKRMIIVVLTAILLGGCGFERHVAKIEPTFVGGSSNSARENQAALGNSKNEFWEIAKGSAEGDRELEKKVADAEVKEKMANQKETSSRVDLPVAEGFKYESSGVGILPGPSVIAMAEAYRIKKQADTLDKMITGLKEGKAYEAGRGRYIIALINNDPKWQVYCPHPEIPGLKVIADPNGGFGFMEVRDIPYTINLYRSDGKIFSQLTPRYEYNFAEKITHKKLVGNVLADWKITVNQVH